MPKELHAKLAKEAKRLGLGGERFRAYVYGTMKRIESGLRKEVHGKGKG